MCGRLRNVSETETKGVSRGREKCGRPMRVGRRGRHSMQHTKKPERVARSVPNVFAPEATCPVIWIGCKGRPTTATHPCLSPISANGLASRRRLGLSQRNGAVLRWVPFTDVTSQGHPSIPSAVKNSTIWPLARACPLPITTADIALFEQSSIARLQPKRHTETQHARPRKD